MQKSWPDYLYERRLSPIYLYFCSVRRHTSKHKMEMCPDFINDKSRCDSRQCDKVHGFLQCRGYMSGDCRETFQCKFFHLDDRQMATLKSGSRSGPIISELERIIHLLSISDGAGSRSQCPTRLAGGKCHGCLRCTYSWGEIFFFRIGSNKAM